MRYQLFTLYENNSTPISFYLTLIADMGTYTIFVDPDNFVALEDFILCIPKSSGNYFYHDKRYLIVVDSEWVQLGLALDDNE